MSDNTAITDTTPTLQELQSRIDALSPRARRIVLKTVRALIDAFLEEEGITSDGTMEVPNG